MDIIRETLWKCDLYNKTYLLPPDGKFLLYAYPGSHFEQNIIYWSITVQKNLIFQLGVGITEVSNRENLL